MLERISWGQYWWAIVIVSAIYYLILLVLLYQKGMLLKLKEKRIQGIKDQPGTSSTQQSTLFANYDIPLETSFQEDGEEITIANDSLMPVVYNHVQEIKEFITDIANRSYVKEEIIMGLQIITRNYKKLYGSPYQQSVNDFILNKCEESCAIHLSAEDLKRIWLG